MTTKTDRKMSFDERVEARRLGTGEYIRLAFYGTLRPGHGLNGWLRDQLRRSNLTIISEYDGTMAGYKRVGYYGGVPFMTLAANARPGEPVVPHGVYVIEIERDAPGTERFMRALDALEGAYNRVPAEVTLDSGEKVIAETYEAKRR